MIKQPWSDERLKMNGVFIGCVSKENADEIMLLQAQLAERDKTILDLANDMDRLLKTLRYVEGIAVRGTNREMRDEETVEAFILGYVTQCEATILEQHTLIIHLIGRIPGNTHSLHARIDEKAKQALEAELKAERIKTLEDAAKWFDANHLIMLREARLCSEELRRMANELRDKSCQ